MKNARVTAYTPDAIREAGEIIAAAILQGGGSGSVSWDQIVLTGTKIAEITINGVVTEVYAPNGGGSGSSVSWNEIQLTGVKIAEITIDGTIYDVYAPDPEAADIDYDNSTSGLVATKVQDAIDEVYAETSANTGNISDLNTEVGAHDTAIGNLQTAVASKANESIIAPVETSLTASRAYAIGEQFILNGVLYTATAAITAGGTITINGNCTASDSVTEQIQALKTPESVSVTTDGVKTMQTLLNELYALIDHTKMSTKATLQYLDYVYVSTNQIVGSTYQFVSATLYNQKIYIQRMTPRAGNSSGADTYNGTTYTNKSTSVPASGNTITIYY